jgi:hypothetical protein
MLDDVKSKNVVETLVREWQFGTVAAKEISIVCLVSKLQHVLVVVGTNVQLALVADDIHHTPGPAPDIQNRPSLEIERNQGLKRPKKLSVSLAAPFPVLHPATN